jgi:hypothetical protein
MNTNIRFHFVAAITASLLLLSCTSTQLSHTWRDASYTAGPLKKILVVAVRKDQVRRRIWEDGFAAALSAHGVDAIPSYRSLAETLPDTGRINTIAREGSFDGIMLIGKASARTTAGVTTSSDLTSEDSPYQQWGGWYSEYYDREYYPGHPVINEIVKDEIKIWAMKGGGRMIWTGVSEVRESDQVEDVSGEIISRIVHALVKQGVIAEGS